MALTNNVITNRNNKKLNYGLARTDFDSNKGPTNESIPSPLPNPAHDLWINSDQIPTAEDGLSPPTENTSDIKVYKYNGSSSNVQGILELTVSTQVAGNRTWLCCSTPGDEQSSLLKNWIRMSYGGAYQVMFAVGPRYLQHINLGHTSNGTGLGTGNFDPSSLTPIYEDMEGFEFYLDYEAGVLTFAGTSLPTGVSDSNTNSVYLISGYRYDGPIGFKNANWTSLVTIDYSQLTIPDTPYLTKIAEVNDPNTNVEETNVHTLLFDVDSGFALDNNNPGEITVRMESTFKTWKVYEDVSSPTSTDVIATAVDTISLFGGNGIKLDADPNIGSKALTINYDNDFINPISNLALQSKTFETNEYEKFVTESGDNIMEENGDVSSNLPSTVRIMSDLKTGAHYLDYTNFTNVPFGLANTQDILDTVNKTFVDALGINADQLDSYDGSYYLNYDNFTNPNGTSDFVGLDYFTFHTITFEDDTLDKNGISMLGDTLTIQDTTDHVVLEESNNIDVLTRSNFTNTFGVGDLDNVTDGANSTSLNDGMVLLYDSSTSMWTPSTIGQVSQGVFQSFTGSQLLGLISGVGTPVPNFDADLLDGEEGSYYLNYDKFSNTPQKYSDFEDDSGNKITNISSMNVGFLGGNDATHFLNYDNFFNEPDVSFFNNDAGYQIASDVTTLIDKTHVDALGINATHLNGYDENDLYSNLVGRPLDLSEFTNSLDYQTLNDITTIVTNDNDISASLLQYKERILTNDEDNICLENGDVTLNLSPEHKFRTEEYIAYDAQHYSNYNNLENIPPGLANTVNVQTAITDTVDKDFVELFNIDAVFLDGQTGSHYLNYLNFYNTPTDLSEFNNDTNFQNLTEVGTAISTYVTNTVDKDFVENLGIDSSILTHSEDFITQDGFKLKEENGEASQNIPSENNIVTEIDERNSDYYLDYVNFTNTPQDLSEFTNLFNFANTVEVDTAIDTKVDKSFVEGLNIDVTSFDGNDSSYYLNYNNLNNRPQNVSSFVNDENFASENFVTSTLTNTVTKTFIENFDIDAKTLNHPEDIVFEPATIDKDGNPIGNFKIEYNFAAFNSYDNLVVTEIDLRDSDYYLNYLNFTNTPQDLSEFTNLFNFANTVEVDIAIDTKVDKEFVENLNVTSANTVLLNDELPTYYLDYSNFTNTPQDLSEFTNLFNFANTQQIQDAVDNLVDSAPGALDTLNELAASLNDDANFATTVTNELSLKANTAQLSNVVFSSSYTDLYDVPIDLHEFTNDTNFANNTQVDQQIDTRVTKTFVDDLNVDANSLRYIETLLTQDGDIIVEENGRVVDNLPSDVHILSEATGEENYDFYLDYTNFTNVPTDVSTFVNDKDYANTSQVNTQIHTTVTKDFVDPLGINASHLQYSQPFIVEDYNTIDDANDPHPLMHWSYDNIGLENGDVTLNLPSEFRLVSDETARGGEFYLNNTNLTIPTNTSDLTNVLKWEMILYDNYQHGSGGASEISLIPTSDAVLVNGEWVVGTEYDLVNNQGLDSDTWKLTRDNSGQGTAFDFPQYFKNNCVPGDIIRVRQTRNHFSLGDHSSDDIYYPFSSAGGANDNWTDFEYVGISGYLQSGDVILKKYVTNTYSAPQDLSNSILPVTNAFITIWRLYSDNFSTRINVNKSIQDNISRSKIVDEFYDNTPLTNLDLYSNSNKELFFNANNLTNHIASKLPLYHSGAMGYNDTDYILLFDKTGIPGYTSENIQLSNGGSPGDGGVYEDKWNPMTSQYEDSAIQFTGTAAVHVALENALAAGQIRVGDECLLRVGGSSNPEDPKDSGELERHLRFAGLNDEVAETTEWWDDGGDVINVHNQNFIRKRLWIKPRRIFVSKYDVEDTTYRLVNKNYVDRLNVDADTLDGEHGTYYRDWNNLTNVPHGLANTTQIHQILRDTDIEAKFLEHILQITTEDNDLIIFEQTDPFEFVTEDGLYYITSHDNLNIVHDSERDFLYLNDEGKRNSTFFLDYTNFTNTPQNIGDFINDRDYANTTQIQDAISGETDIAASSLILSFHLTTEFGDNIVEENGDVTLNLTSDIKFIEEDRTRETEYFLDYTNFTNTPQNISDFTNDLNFQDATQVESLIGSTKLSELDDVDNYGPAGDPNAPSVGQVLAWTGTKWGVTNQSGGSGGGSGGAVTLDGLLDVDTSTVVPSTAQVLQYDMNGNQEWTNQTLYSNTITIGQSIQDFGGSGMLDGVSTMIHSGQTVADAFDIMNETILNLYTQTYVRDALFTFATVGEESGHQNHYHVPLTLQFTDDETFPKLEPEGPTHTWTFEHADANTGVIYWPGHTAAGQTVVESGTSEAYKNPTHTWNEVGTFKVTHKMELLGGTAMFPGSAGSFAENFTYITTIPPIPIPNFSVSPSQQEIDLDGGGTTVNFSDGSQFATHFMYEWGDGTVHPVGASSTDPLGTTSGVPWDSTGTVSHLYQSTYSQQYTVKLHVYHTDHNNTTGGIPNHCITEEKVNYISGYIALNPTFSITGGTSIQGNNQAPEDNVAAGNANLEGHKVEFTDTTAGMSWGFGQSLQWNFSANPSDGPDIQKTDGSNGYTETPTNIGLPVTRYFKRDNTSAPATVNYDVTLTAVNGHSNSPFTSAPQTVIVDKDPRSNFSYEAKNNNTGGGDYEATNIGYEFIGYGSGTEYNWMTFTDTSENVDGWSWDFDNDGTVDQVTQGPHDYQFVTGTYSTKLIATSSSLSQDYHWPTIAEDDTEIKNGIITIRPAPSAPSGLGSTTLTSFPASVGDTPRLVTGHTNNDSNSTTSPGQNLNRQVGTAELSAVMNTWANKFPSNGDNSGTLTAVVNGTDYGSISLGTSQQITTAGNSNDGQIEITDDVDANDNNSSTYPIDFYRQFKAKIKRDYNTRGVNTFQIKYTDTNGDQTTDIITWVHDTISSVPVINTPNLIETVAGSTRNVSGIPYYNTGATLQVTGLTCTNISGETYREASDFIKVDNDTGTIISTQNKNYSDVLAMAIPVKDLGALGAYSINNFDVPLNGSSGKGTATLKLRAKTVTGETAYSSAPQILRYWKDPVPVDETNLGNGWKRVLPSGWTGQVPQYTPANFVATAAYSGTTSLAGLSEAVVNFNGEIVHDETDYSGELPVGPDYSSGRSGTQYINFAVNATTSPGELFMSFTGELASAWLTIPGVTEQYSVTYFHEEVPATSPSGHSGLTYGWWDMANFYGYSGNPGSNGTVNGYSGIDNFDAENADQLLLNTPGTYSCAFIFGGVKPVDPGNKNSCIVVRLGIAPGKKIENLTLSFP